MAFELDGDRQRPRPRCLEELLRGALVRAREGAKLLDQRVGAAQAAVRDDSVAIPQSWPAARNRLERMTMSLVRVMR